MSYRYGNRNQINMFPECIEDNVGSEDPVRGCDAIVEKMEFEKLGITIDPKKVGNAEYDPKAMLKLLVYAYSYGWKSSRKIERACYHNLSFM